MLGHQGSVIYQGKQAYLYADFLMTADFLTIEGTVRRGGISWDTYQYHLEH